jgi:hypothetical protein
MESVQVNLYSCDYCQKVVFDINPEFERLTTYLYALKDQVNRGALWKEPLPESGEQEEDMASRGQLFDITYDDLCAGAANGCQFFKDLMEDEWISRVEIQNNARRHLDIDNPDSVGWGFRDSSLWLEDLLPEANPENTLQKINEKLEESVHTCCLWASTYQGTSSPLDIEYIQFFGLWDPDSRKIICRARHSFQVYAHPDDPASDYVSNRPIARYPGSSNNLAMVSSWLKSCQENHSCKAMQGEMPSRLIEITSTPEQTMLRLKAMETTDHVPFAVLSYCWGGEQPMQLTRSNFTDYERAILFEEQAQTIKDAIKVCQSIGLQYLWVDALCIVQNDLNDKSVEIAKMPSIYGSATVTIAAARSSSASDGFLSARYPGERRGFKLPYRCYGGHMGSINLVQLGGGHEAPEPIDERGWTLQERLCSTRIIEFGTRQTRWICPETRSSEPAYEAHNAHESLTDGWKTHANYSSKRRIEGLDLDDIRTAKDTIDLYGRPRNSRYKDYSNAMENWENICATFTERALTHTSDRALAISGIAQIFAELTGDRYMAGLWKSCLHSGLLWKIKHSKIGPKDIPKPTTYQAPSWSWLSVNGPVFFGQKYKPADCAAEILSVETEPANGAAPYGLIREGSGRLVLSARTAPGVRSKVPLRAPGQFKDKVMMIGFDKELICYAHAEMDCDIFGLDIDPEEEEAGVLLVEITRADARDNNLSCQGLVLQWASTERKAYRRVGRFNYWGRRKGRRFKDHIKEGEDEDVGFNWFTGEPKVIEII